MEKQYRNVLVLSATQSTLQITGVTMTAVTGLAGTVIGILAILRHWIVPRVGVPLPSGV